MDIIDTLTTLIMTNLYGYISQRIIQDLT